MSYHLADGVLTNTFSKIEESTTRAFPQLVYTAGPIIQSATKIGDEPNDSVCVKWLGKQKPNTVLYVCKMRGVAFHLKNEQGLNLF